MTSRKTLLFISAAGCQVRAWHHGALSAATQFPNNDEGLASFASHMRACRNQVIILADLVEEDFRHETIPHLQRRERAALIRRKLEQYYRSTPFRQAATLRHRSNGKREEDVLFSAITNPAHIAPWLEIMLEHGIALAGIHSVANLSAPLLKNIPDENLLLLSWEKHAGLRQTYFDSGQVRFSRLTSISDRCFGATAETESIRIQQYLNNMSLLPPDSPLSVYIICHAGDRRELEVQLHDSSYMRYRYLDIQVLGLQAGSAAAFTDSDATPLFMQLSATRQARSHYAAAEHTRFLRLSHMRRFLSGISAATVAGSLLWAAANLAAGIKLSDDTQAARTQADLLVRQARQITQSFPDNLAPASHMKTAVLLSRRLDKYSPPPQQMLGGLSMALETFPDIQLNKLSWQSNLAMDASLTGETADIPAPSIVLEGDLSGFPGDRRAALSYIEGFRQSLELHGYTVTATVLPFDASPRGNISADIAGDDHRPAPISLRLDWKGPA